MLFSLNYDLVIMDKWTDEDARRFEQNLMNAEKFIEEHKKSRRLPIMKLMGLMRR